MALWPNTLRTLRTKAKLSRVKVAAALDVSELTIYRWEKGTTGIPYRSLSKLATLLGVVPTDIYPFLGRQLVGMLEEEDTP